MTLTGCGPDSTPRMFRTEAGSSGFCPLSARLMSIRVWAWWTFFDPGEHCAEFDVQHSGDRRDAAALGVHTQSLAFDLLRVVMAIAVWCEAVFAITASVSLLASGATVLGKPIRATVRAAHVMSVYTCPGHVKHLSNVLECDQF